MTSQRRAELIAKAKSLAIPVASCVAARLRPDHLLGARTNAELAALVIVLAEAADPVRLRAVVAAGDDDGGEPVTDRTVVLRRAHAEVNRLREERLPVPSRLGVLENQYQVMVRARRLHRRAGDEGQQREGEAA